MLLLHTCTCSCVCVFPHVFYVYTIPIQMCVLLMQSFRGWNISVRTHAELPVLSIVCGSTYARCRCSSVEAFYPRVHVCTYVHVCMCALMAMCRRVWKIQDLHQEPRFKSFSRLANSVCYPRIHV